MSEDNDDICAKQLLVSYIQNKNFNSQILDEQLQLQDDAYDLVTAVRSDVDYDDPKRDFWLSREIKGRVEHKRLLRLIYELEKNIEHCIELMSSKHSLVFSSDFRLADLQNRFSSSIMKEYPQLVSLIMEFQKSIEELLEHAKVLSHMEWNVLDFDVDKVNLEEEEIDFGDSWNREINVKDDLNVYDALDMEMKGEIPEVEIEYHSDDDLHGHLDQIADQLTTYYKKHMDIVQEVDLSQVVDNLTNKEKYKLQQIVKNFSEHSQDNHNDGAN